MRHLLALTLCLLTVLCPLSVSAVGNTTVKGGVTYYTEGILTYTIKDGEVTITDCDVRRGKGSVSIPNTLQGYPVTVIGEYAFYDCSYLINLTLPDSVRRIEDYAFSLCVDMQYIALGAAVEHIGNSVFTDTDSLRTITVAAENPYLTVDKGILYSKDKTVLYLAPLGTVQQETFVIPDGVTTIHSGAFGGNNYLHCVVMPDSVTTVGSNAFLLCKNLEQVVLSANLQRVGQCAFWNCGKLEQVWYNGTDAQLAAMVIEKSNQLLDLTWQPIDEATLQGLLTPSATPSDTDTTTVTTTTATATSGKATTVPSNGTNGTQTTPSPLPWLIAGVCLGLLIAVSAVLVIVLCRKKK